LQTADGFERRLGEARPAVGVTVGQHHAAGAESERVARREDARVLAGAVNGSMPRAAKLDVC
jgi:hypothetical protein